MSVFKYIVGLFTLLVLLSSCASTPSSDAEKLDPAADSDRSIINMETENSVAKEDSQDLVFDDLPKDLLIPENATLIERNKTEGNSIMVTYEVPGLLVDDQDIYKNFLIDKGYEIQEINMSDQMIVFQGSKTGDDFLYYHLVGQENASYTLKIEYGKYD